MSGCRIKWILDPVNSEHTGREQECIVDLNAAKTVVDLMHMAGIERDITVQIENTRYKEWEDLVVIPAVGYKARIEKLEYAIKKLEADDLQVMKERDYAEDMLQKIDIALGGDGVYSNNRCCGVEALEAAKVMMANTPSEGE